MNTPLPDMPGPNATKAEHHRFTAACAAHSAECARRNAKTYRSYLNWSTDRAQRRWAERQAATHDALARVYDRHADIDAESAEALETSVTT